MDELEIFHIIIPLVGHEIKGSSYLKYFLNHCLCGCSVICSEYDFSNNT